MLALVLFGLAAVGGLIMAIGRFKGAAQPPLPLALIHGAAAAAGLVVLLLAVVDGAMGLTRVALVLMVGAALGGFVLFAKHLQKKELPIGLMVIHALVAVAGFSLLVVATL